jgi:Ca2+-transporting ATPase
MWFNEKSEDIVQNLESDFKDGLTDQEASSRLEKFGPNKLKDGTRQSMLRLMFEQINDPLIYVLVAAAAVSIFLNEISDAVIIAVVIILNAVIGVIQESKAEKALESLKKLTTPKAVVRRNGEVQEIPSENIVPGDIILLDAGRYVPCDIRIIECAGLKIEESALTGESLPSEKSSDVICEDQNISPGDQKNMAFMSTLVTYGRGTGIAVASGMNTEMGKIAKMLDESGKNLTPLQKKLASLGKLLGIMALFVCALIFVIGLLQGRDIFEMFLTAISLAVAAIPEGLPAIVTIVLAIGVQKMIKENAVVRKLPAVETLGAVNIICSDKTGTLTQNKMTVTKFYSGTEVNDVSKLDIEETGQRILAEGMVLCNDAVYSANSKAGDSTEIALLEAGSKFGISKSSTEKEHPRVDEVPFDSERKLMTTVNRYGEKLRVITKGAVDNLVNISTKVYLNGEISSMDDMIRSKILSASNKMSDDALRVLGMAYKEIDTRDKMENLEKDLVFVGLYGMIDPPRENAEKSIAECRESGIRTVMITGDHKNTAFAIAKELGIADDESQAVLGAELDNMTEEEIKERIDNLRVFARVSPEHKVKIVKALRENGNIVSMTGDGVNDAPSLKAADIGVAMGITGTDVAKGAADMILVDDNFSTIVSAVKEGRNIYNNIKKSINFLLSCNIGEIAALFIAIVIGWPAILRPIHLLWINLITDSLPALALGVDPGDPDIIKEKPRDPKEGLFSNGNGYSLLLNGVIIGFTTLFAFYAGTHFYPDSIMHAQTMAFVVLSVSQLFYTLSVRHHKKSIFKIGIFTNKYLVFAIIVGILLQNIIITIPALSSLFKVYRLTARDWIFVTLISLLPLVLNEIFKIFRKDKSVI